MSDETPQWIKDMEPKRESIVDKMFPRRDPGDARERVRTRTCCGCSCHVCVGGHNTGREHTAACGHRVLAAPLTPEGAKEEA